MTRSRSDLIAALRSDLASADFSVASLTGLWGPDADAALHRNQRVPAIRALAALRARLGRSTAAATLAELFVLGLPVECDRVAEALPQLGIDGADDLDLVDGEGVESVLPLVDLRPYSFIDSLGVGSWWIVSDLGELSLGHAVREDHVLGVGGASLTLTGLMISSPVASALDLGTGCGIQALHAARHAERVVATDISARALAIAGLNAELNGVTNITFRLGSLFEPVAGERFDQIVSNPPFVITPRAEGVPSYEYRDGGLVGDQLVEAVLRGATAHLTPGGVAQFLGNWEYRDGREGLDRVADWVVDAGNEVAWVIERDVQHPTEYAETWIRDGGTRPGTPDFDRLYGAWLDDFAARGVSAVGFGYVTLRRASDDADGDELGAEAGAERGAGAGLPAGLPLNRFEQVHGPLGSSGSGLGTHLADALAAHAWQARLDDDALAAVVLLVAPDVTVERHYWPGDDDPTAMTLRQGGAFARSLPVETGLAALVGACDGELAVGAICDAIAHLLEADATELRRDLLPRVRALIDDGFLLRS